MRVLRGKRDRERENLINVLQNARAFIFIIVGVPTQSAAVAAAEMTTGAS